MKLCKRALLSCMPEQGQLPAAVRAAAAGLGGLGHASFLLMSLEAPELTAVQMVPPGSHEIYEKCYPIKEGAGWLCAFTSAPWGSNCFCIWEMFNRIFEYWCCLSKK